MIDFNKDDIKALIRRSDYEQLDVISSEIRKFLIEKVSRTGGHLASNLGIVELTIALHRVYDTPADKIIFDVGHQAYVHKIITGRAPLFDTLRQYKGLSGFPKTHESDEDIYETGHSSTSVSAAAGLAEGMRMRGDMHKAVAVIGDGSMSGGLVYEALNNIGSRQSNVKIVLNDNGMSIARNVGAISKHLQRLRSSQGYARTKSSVKATLNRVPVLGRPLSNGISSFKERIKFSVLDEEGIIFEELGIKYIGPVDGHDIRAVEEALEAANAHDGPTVVHVITVKGKGYRWAEKYPRKFHGVGPFNIENGNILSSTKGKTYSEVFGETITELAREDSSIVSVAAAMGTATGLGAFYEAFPERYYDVGIAEEHAVVFAAGLARAGLKPVIAIYSSFLQRAIDMIIEDVCLQGLHVIFAIDRAGLVGADGETHHGQFDLSYLSMIPNMRILCPADGKQLSEMLEYAVNGEGPFAIRYPRGSSLSKHGELEAFSGANSVLSEGRDVMIMAVGSMLDTALEAAAELRSRGFDAGVTNVSVVKPFDDSLIELDAKLAVTIEDNVLCGGFGELFAARAQSSSCEVITMAIPDSFVAHGSVGELREECGLTAADIVREVTERLEGKA